MKEELIDQCKVVPTSFESLTPEEIKAIVFDFLDSMKRRIEKLDVLSVGWTLTNDVTPPYSGEILCHGFTFNMTVSHPSKVVG